MNTILRKKIKILLDNADEMWMLCWPLLSFSLECEGLSSYLLQNKFVNCNLLYRFYNAANC